MKVSFADSCISYMSEEQAFWLLEVLCDRLLPGYYSPSMHGTLLDQKVFESLVQRCLPMIHDHFQVVDVQLSVASLPWFLSLYVLKSHSHDGWMTLIRFLADTLTACR